MLFAALVCLFPQFALAEGESVEASSSESISTTSSAPVAGENLGTGIFSRIPFQISATVRAGYDDNVSTTNFDKQGSFFTTAGLALTYSFGTPRTTLSLGTNFGFTYYADQGAFSEGNNAFEPNLNLTLNLSHKATPRLSFKEELYTTYQAEPDFTIAQGINRRGGNFFFIRNQFTTIYLWTPRFSTATSYSVTRLQYDESAIGAFEDRFENTIGNEFRFLVLPTTLLVAEYRFGVVSYDSISRDSTTHYFLGGLDHKFNPRLSGSFRGGVEVRDFESSGSHTSPYFEGTLEYALGKDTAISWTNRYSIEESDAQVSQGRRTFRTGLQGKHNFTARISGSFGVYYEHDDYLDFGIPGVNTSFTEESVDVSLSLRYAVTRYLGIEAGYSHTEVTSDFAIREYSRNRFWGGLNLAF